MDSQLREIIDRLKERQPLQPLSPKRIWNRSLDIRIRSLALSGKTSDPAAIALMAGLHLWNDNLDESHSYAQKIEDDATGSYWHGLMHRMEGDYSNAKYWFRQAAGHPVMDRVRQRAADSPIFKDQGKWDPYRLVDMVALQESGSASEETRRPLEELQYIEMSELLDYTCQALNVR